MPNTIRHKRGTTTPAASALVTGEIAINTATGAAFTKTDAGTVVAIGGGVTTSDLGNGNATAGALVLAALQNANAPSSTNQFATEGDLNSAVASFSAQVASVKAWVNFAGVGSGTFAGGTSTVSRTAATTTCTVTTTTAHGLAVGNVVYALTGVTVGSYTVTTVPTATTFTFTTVESTVLSAASITFAVTTINASFNVSSVTDNGIGDYTVNFTTAFADNKYALLSSSYGRTGFCVGLHTAVSSWTGVPTLKTTTAARIATSYYDANLYDTNEVHVAFLR